MNDPLAQKIADYITEGNKALNDSTECYRWENKVTVFLEHMYGYDIMTDFKDIIHKKGASAGVGLLEVLLTKMMGRTTPSHADDLSGVSLPNKDDFVSKSDKKVFLVHGHDTAAKETVARFVERIGLSPIILHEQPNLGKTVIEKFEIFSDVHYAVVLLTPDDVGHSVNEPAKTSKRARQNVVLELGYFLGKLGRARVAALYKHDVEMPSDYQGVVFIKLDDGGAWKTKLAQEFVQAGLSIRLEGLL